MNDRHLLNSWKEIAAYLSRGVRTVQRWEVNYNLPVRRPSDDSGSVYAFADEIDAWLERSRPRRREYVRPALIVLDVVTPNALSDLKLAIEGAKFNVLTAFTATEMLSTAQRYAVDGFIVDSVVLDVDPTELGKQLRQLYPQRPRILVGDDPAEDFDAVIPPGNPAAVVDYLVRQFGPPLLDR